MTRRSARVLAWTAAVGGVLLLAWIALVARGSIDPAATAAPRAHAPVAPASFVAAAEPSAVAASAPRAIVHGDAVVVRGAIAGAEPPGMVWFGERRELGSAPFTEENGFSLRCAAPLARLHVRAMDSRGSVRTWDFTRPDDEASSPWDLGELRFGGAEVSVDLTVEYEPAVVQRMMATGQRRLDVEVREDRVNGPLVASCAFDFATFTETTRTSVLRTLKAMVVSADTDLFLLWTCCVETRSSKPNTLRRTDPLGGHLGVLRSARLDLVPEQEVRGTVTTADGEPCHGLGVTLVWSSRSGSVALYSAEDGSYSFHVGSDGHGKVGLAGTIQELTGYKHMVPFTPGTVVDLRLAVEKWQFRLVDERGAPIESYRVISRLAFALKPNGYLRTNHPDGIAWQPRVSVERFPWLAFWLHDERLRLFLVPAAWLDAGARSTHDVSVTSFLPSGSLQILVDGATPASWGRMTSIEWEGQRELHGFGTAIYRVAPASGPWRIDDVPVGTYRYKVISADKGLHSTGEVVVVAGRVTDVNLIRR